MTHNASLHSSQNTETIELPRSIVNQLLEQALSAPNAEVCGLIASLDGIPCHCYPISNVATEPQSHFQLDPRQQISALREMREQDQALFAIYHSHPNTPATPSTEDVEQMNYPEAFYLIISLHTTGTLQMRAFRFLDNAFQNINVNIVDPVQS
jgi:proteasome lid subunit RPN8/RPN11